MQISDIVYLGSNLIFLYGMHLFYEKMFPEGGERRVKVLTLLLYFVIDFLLYRMISVPYLLPLTAFLTDFCVTAAYNRRISYKNFLAAIMVLVIGICGELLASHLVVFFMRLMGREDSENALIAALIISRLLFFFLMIIASGWIRSQREKVTLTPVSVLTASLPVLSIGVILYVFSLAEFDHRSILNAGSLGAVFSVLAVIGINLATFWLFDRQLQMSQIEKEAENLRRTVQIQQEHYNGEMKRREAIRQIRHDYKNFLLALQSDIASGHIEDAARSIAGQLENSFMDSLPQSGFYALDAIAGHKAAMAEKKGIRLIPEYRLEGTPEIRSEDVCVLIGNALDNAVEYLEAHLECRQEILMHVVYKEGAFSVKIRNEVSEPVRIRDSREVLTEKKGEGHGYGLRSIDYIAQKYHGRLILVCRDSVFECGALLYC